MTAALIFSFVLIWQNSVTDRIIHSMPGYQNYEVCKQAARRMSIVAWHTDCIPGPDEKEPSAAPEMQYPRELPSIPCGDPRRHDC
jgi:hypothetical protein